MHLVPCEDLPQFFFMAITIDKCVIFNDKHETFYYSSDFHCAYCTVVPHNSTNVHAIGDKWLFIDVVKSFPVDMNVATIKDANDSQRIGVARFY